MLTAGGIGVLLASLAAPAALSADPDDVCTGEPRDHWMTPSAIADKAVAAGYSHIYTVQALTSCYRLDAMTVRRRHAKVIMDPVSGDVVRAEIDN